MLILATTYPFEAREHFFKEVLPRFIDYCKGDGIVFDAFVFAENRILPEVTKNSPDYLQQLAMVNTELEKFKRLYHACGYKVYDSGERFKIEQGQVYAVFDHSHREMDFSAFRNNVTHILDNPRTDWLFWLDCDEEITPINLFKAKSIAEQMPDVVEACGVGVIAPQPTLGNNDMAYSVGCPIRMHRIAMEISYLGRVHEDPAFTVTGFSKTSVVLTHHGYEADGEVFLNKMLRNTRCLVKDVNDLSLPKEMREKKFDELIRAGFDITMYKQFQKE